MDPAGVIGEPVAQPGVPGVVFAFQRRGPFRGGLRVARAPFHGPGLHHRPAFLAGGVGGLLQRLRGVDGLLGRLRRAAGRGLNGRDQLSQDVSGAKQVRGVLVGE